MNDFQLFQICITNIRAVTARLGLIGILCGSMPSFLFRWWHRSTSFEKAYVSLDEQYKSKIIQLFCVDVALPSKQQDSKISVRLLVMAI